MILVYILAGPFVAKKTTRVTPVLFSYTKAF